MKSSLSRKEQIQSTTDVSLAVNMTLRAGGTRFLVQEIRDDGCVVLEHKETKERKEIRKDVLLSAMGVTVHLEENDESLAPSNATREELELIAKLPVDMHSKAQIGALISKTRWISLLKSRGMKASDELEDITLKMLSIKPDVPRKN
jgi:hypothetical protein